MIVATLLVRDEDEIVEANITHHLNNGVDCFIVTDNGSIDNTKNILKKFEKHILNLVTINEYNYNQDKWVTAMTREAFKHGADWVINLDADEFWCNVGYLNTISKKFGKIALGPYRNHVPLYGLTYGEFSESTMPYWVVAQHPGRVAYRPTKDSQVTQGNHDVYYVDGGYVFLDCIPIHHYPVRSYKHFETKVRNGGSAYINAGAGYGGLGTHWRQWYESYLNGSLKDVYYSMVYDPYYAMNNFNVGIDIKEEYII